MCVSLSLSFTCNCSHLFFSFLAQTQATYTRVERTLSSSQSNEPCVYNDVIAWRILLLPFFIHLLFLVLIFSLCFYFSFFSSLVFVSLTLLLILPRDLHLSIFTHILIIQSLFREKKEKET